MENSVKLQFDVRNNAQDLQNYVLDLNNWEEEMKRKESELNNIRPSETAFPPPRNKIKRSKSENEKNSAKPKKISAYDYSAWDKFDVEKACAEIDENDSSEEINHDQTNKAEETCNNEKSEDDNSCEKNFSLIDEAFYEKEMGNEFVKKGQWADAIKCYTNAINLDSNNAIYYANRSLCFLKLNSFKSAETDATTAIQLDKSYVKAYQRRAFARQALGQLAEAKSDYEEILKLEPKNALSRVEINKIDNKLKNNNKMNGSDKKKTFNPLKMFKSEESEKETKEPNNSKIQKETCKRMPSKSETVTTKPGTAIKESNLKTETTNRIDNKKEVVVNNKVKPAEKGGDGDKLSEIETSKLTFRNKIFKPLPEGCKIIYPVNIPPHKRSKKPLKKINITFTDKEEEYSFTEENTTDCCESKKIEENVIVDQSRNQDESKDERLSFDVPKTAIQFQKCWKILKKNPEEAYRYLKQIPGKEFPQIFENSLESDFFSELVTFLADDKVEKEPDVIYDVLMGLSSVKRFSSLILFMSETDKSNVKKSLIELKKFKSEEEICQLLRLYELKV